ncbi:cyclin-domain-containing protein [Gamsiella multidivaricata]|uniref:cyclin-domain-containing protein n=1 Tax=Gamsiella multidivaricata TaxID=101098 RepID=UPI0022201BDD|nr:cyclin-domain-containing protein [Gamsiella multidivaricata]KAI7822561.1 cyclin-domain-containing protein [Gamsiella multidivaricata]
MLCRLTAHNDQIPLTSANLTRFHSRAPPQISVYDYLRRIVKYTSLERACLLVILIYIDRVCEKVRTFTISSLTVHRFIIASVTLAAKAVCDSYCTNSHYAKVGGLSTQELNTLEVEFLGLIEWRVAVEGTVMQRYYVNLVRQHSRFEIAETVPHSISASHPQDDENDHMNSSSQDSDGDQVVVEHDYEEGLRDQWIPMGE